MEAKLLLRRISTHRNAVKIMTSLKKLYIVSDRRARDDLLRNSLYTATAYCHTELVDKLLDYMRRDLAPWKELIESMVVLAMGAGKLKLVKLLLIASYSAGSSVTSTITTRGSQHFYCRSCNRSSHLEIVTTTLIEVACHLPQRQELLTLLVSYDNQQRHQP